MQFLLVVIQHSPSLKLELVPFSLQFANLLLLLLLNLLQSQLENTARLAVMLLGLAKDLFRLSELTLELLLERVDLLLLLLLERVNVFLVQHFELDQLLFQLEILFALERYLLLVIFLQYLNLTHTLLIQLVQRRLVFLS